MADCRGADDESGGRRRTREKQESGVSRLPLAADDGPWANVDLDRLVRSTFVKRVEFYRQICSTNDRALELARQPDNRYPILVLAENQTAGRGREANRWWARPGALTFSLLIETETAQLPPRLWPRVSVTAGLAVAEAIEDLLPACPIHLKWPNDVYVERRKACGILVELPTDRPGMLVLGIGINVNNSLRDAPQDLHSSAIALCDAAERKFSLIEVLQRVLLRLELLLPWIGRHDDELKARWRQRCLMTNRTVHIDVGPRSLVGLCRGIDEDGALILETADGLERCFAGVVTQF